MIGLVRGVLTRASKTFEWILLGSVIIGGDLVVQVVEHNQKISKRRDDGKTDACTPNTSFEVDFSRLKGVTVTAFGFLVPIAVAWYPFLHRLMATRFSHLTEGSLKYVMTKSILENTLLPAPVCLGYFIIPAYVEGGHQWDTLNRRLQVDLVPSIITDTSFWSFLAPINYKFIAVKYQPLFSCILDCIESAGLSFLTHQEDFKWPFMDQ